jgi:hypothetical protein
LLNENVWIGKNNVDFDNFELVLETFDILISNGFNFIEFSMLKNEFSNKSEIVNMLINPYQFYVNIMHKDSRIPSELQDKIFKYISIRMNLKNPDLFISSIQQNPSIIATINSFIDDHYTEERILEKRLESTESFLGALINKNNRINPELRDRLYDYFNKITDSNSMLFIDNMQFFLSRNVNVMTHEIFKLIVLRESTQISERNIINGLLSNLVGRKDLIRYFQSINIELIKHRFIDNILQNHKEWIEEVIQHQQLLNPNVPIDEFRTNDYGVLMMILGIGYSKGYMCDEISTMVLRIIEEDNINLIKPFGIFLEMGQINPNELEPMMYELISKYIHKYYFDPQTGMREKFIIETILSTFVSFGKKFKIDIRVKNIEQFMNFGTFLIAKPISKPSKVNWTINTTNKFAVIYKSDEESDNSDSDDDSVNSDVVKCSDKKLSKQKVDGTFGDKFYEEFSEEFEDTEIAEPDEQILRQINTYFKSNDSDESFDDLKYFIETAKIPIKFKDFTYALFYSFGERTLRDIIQIKTLIQKMSEIQGFEGILLQLISLIKTSTGLVEMLHCDNPKLMEIIAGIN